MLINRRSFGVVLSVAGLWALPGAAAAQDAGAPPVTVRAAEVDYAARLERLLDELESQRVQHNVPGLGIAVVHGDTVLLCEGLGQADLEHDIAATGDTVFAIGSATKAFTATLIGMLVDEGAMDWDASVHDYLPDFHLHDAEADAQVTIRDLLSHQTGLSRMGLLWASGRLNRAEILAAVVDAEPMYPFRTQFNYSNINYIAAGEASAAAAGTTWEQLVQQRLLEPLEMDSATVTVPAARTLGRLAVGYQYDEHRKAFEIDPMRPIDAGAPAGAINASACDMANWLRLQINDGRFNGTQLIRADTLAETRREHVSMAPGVGYALGWMLNTYDGWQVVEHGGNIDGFSAQVAYITELDLGYVLLMNCSFSQLQAAANSVVFGALLTDETDLDDSIDDEPDLDAYVGSYVADFGPFDDARWTVAINDDGLTVDVPGQMAYALKPPDEEGKWYFAMTDQIAVSFSRADDGSVTGLVLHQGGLRIDMPREGVEIPAEVALSDVQPFFGRYHFQPMDQDFEVLMRNGRLAVDVPGQMIYELHQPDDEDRWYFRATDTIWVRFNRDDDGAVTSMTMWQQGFENELPRIAGPDHSDESVTLEDVLALHQQAVGGAHVDAVGTLRMAGDVAFVNQALRGTIEIVAEGLTHYRMHMDLGRVGTLTVIVAGDRGWNVSSFDPTDELEGEYLDAAIRQHPLMLAADWRTIMDEVSLSKVQQTGDGTRYVLRARLGEMIRSTITLDAETGLVIQEDLVMMAPGIGALPMKVTYDDYRTVDGIKFPYRVVNENLWHGRMIIEFNSIETGVELADDAFAPPADADNVVPKPADG